VAYVRPYKDGHRAEVEKHGMRASKTFKTKRDANAWAIRKEAEFDALKGSKGRTFGWAREHYVKTVSRDKRDGADEWEERRLAAMAEFFGDDTLLAAIDSQRIGQWRDWRLDGDDKHKPVGGSSVQREANLLRNLFTIAANEWKCITANPFKGVRLPEHGPARQAVWGWREIRRVLRANRIGKTREVIHAFHIALHTGMRLSEVLAAKVDGKVAVLPKDKTTKAAVKVPLARKGAALLKLYGRFTVGPNEASTLFSELLSELLIEGLTFHDSRASALTWLSRRMDVMTLARISRHKDLRILMDTYYRETAEQIAARI
jgi:integrase